jgi:hypothetical protein
MDDYLMISTQRSSLGPFPHISLSVSVSLCLSLSVSLSVSLSFSLCLSLSVSLSLSMSLSVSLSLITFPIHSQRLCYLIFTKDSLFNCSLRWRSQRIENKVSLRLSCAHLRHALITLLFTCRVNFDFDFEGRGERVRLSKILTPVIQWCGLNIDITHLEVRLVACLSVC